VTPFVVRATLAQALVATHPIALDALLAAVVAGLRRFPPPELEYHDAVDLPIPLQLHLQGFYHASEAHLVVQEFQARRWTRKLPDLRDLVLLTSAAKLPTSGRYKAFWVPLRLALPAGMRLTWWGFGDVAEVRALLRHVLALGAKRASGYGWVARWEVVEIEEDRSVFTCDEAPARPLPRDLAPDWLYLRFCRIMHPYWRAEGSDWRAVPETFL